MNDDAPVIYGLEYQARALCPQQAETDAIRFLVGTQSLKSENQVSDDTIFGEYVLSLSFVNN